MGTCVICPWDRRIGRTLGKKCHGGEGDIVGEASMVEEHAFADRDSVYQVGT